MATKVPIPKLGQSEETVTIENWKVKEGDKIKKGDVLFEIETDKAVLEVESQFEGELLKVLIPSGKEVPVMSIAAVIGEPGEEIPEIEQPKLPESQKKSLPDSRKPAKKTSHEEKQKSESQPKEKIGESTGESTAVSTEPEMVGKPKPSPRARRFARDYLINIDKVMGTGGEVRRVTEKDVRQYLETSGYFNRKITPAAFNLARKEQLELLNIEGTGESGRVTLADVRDAVSEKPQEFTTIRKIIAQRLTQSKQQIPHFYVTASIEMNALLQKRKEMKDDGINISVNVFIIKAVAMALKKFPMLNAQTDGNTYQYKAKVNIGVAVSLENGLVVPVVRDADKKALDEIHAVVAELADKARNGKITPEEMQGGTFTISNMGMLNVENFAAIINPGESGILAVSSSVPSPVVRDGKVVIRDMMKITLSADHRVVDGADGARFVNAVKENLEVVDFGLE